MEVTSRSFPEASGKALAKDSLQKTLALLRFGAKIQRENVRRDLPEFDALRDAGKAIKDHALAHLDLYLEIFMRRASAAGAHVHWCSGEGEALDLIVRLAREAGARTIAKSKSMVSEEIGLSHRLEAEGFRPVETDLGEYIVQIRHEPPSHIIGPALHLNRFEVADSFRATHTDRSPDRPLDSAPLLIAEAREVLREAFMSAELGITGANFLVAETGSVVLVTNEGNADFATVLPRTHIVLTGIEKIVPTLEDVSAILRILARSATGQEATAYTTFLTGARRQGDADGPETVHIVLLDNGRSSVLGTQMQDMLRCIRCAACLNNCPVYAAVGGHSYGSVYPGPMGAVLTPILAGIEKSGHLPNASTFCGKCEDVCPMRIPLPKMMRHWREREFARGLAPPAMRWGLGAFRALAARPRVYRALMRVAVRVLRMAARGPQRRVIERLPLLASGWTAHRSLRAPARAGFIDAYHKARRKEGRR